MLAFAEATTGLAQEAEAHAQLALRSAAQPAGLRDRNRPPRACNGALYAAQLRRGRALVRIRNPGFASGTDPPCPDDSLQRPGRDRCARQLRAGLHRKRVPR